jgi:RHS repeat-associated protein
MVRHIAAVLIVMGSFCAAPGAASAAVGRTAGEGTVTSTGAAVYSIPIWAPPGINGLTPDVAITYNHRSGDGLLGMGFALGGFSAIERCNNTIAQDGVAQAATLSTFDSYCLDGNRLRLTSGTHGAPGSLYQTELETWSRIRAQASAGNGPAWWEVHRKDGLIYEYGNSADSRIETVGSPTARLWALSKIRDRVGNAITFTYTEDTANGSYRPAEIHYGGLPSAGHKVVFGYETGTRPDPLFWYRFGNFQTGIEGPINQFKRLNKIEVVHVAMASVVRTYDLAYQASGGAGARSRLESITECVAADCLSSTTFQWINGSASWVGETTTSQPVTTDVNSLVLDINGDGREDFLFASSTVGGFWYYFLGGTGGYQAVTTTTTPAVNYEHAQAIEWNGDGFADVLVPCNGTGTWCVMTGSATGLSGYTDTGTPLGAGAELTLAADTNGDGRHDLVRLIRSSLPHRIGIRLRETAGFGAENVNAWVGGSVNPRLPTSVAGLRIARFQTHLRRMDFDGDGREDFMLRLTDQGFGGEPSTNYWVTFFGRGSNLAAAENLGTSTTITPIAGDFNGDGLSDLAYRGPTNWIVIYAQGFAHGSGVTGPPVIGGTDSLMADWDGDGLTDLLQVGASPVNWLVARSTGNGFLAYADTGLPAGGTSSSRVTDVNGDGLHDIARRDLSASNHWKLRLHAGVWPDLLDRATDGFGNFVDFNYAPLTDSAVYSKQTGASYPEIDYAGPFYVVNQHSASNGIGGSYSVSHMYHGARRDLHGRGFEGFLWRYTSDNRNGVHQYDYFRREFPFTGVISRSDVFQPSGTLARQIVNTWNAHTYESGYVSRHLPFLQQSVTYDYEVGGAYNGVHKRTTSITNAVDVTTGTLHDSTTVVTEPASANGVQSGASYTQRLYHSSLANDFGNWCFGRPQVTEAINSHTLYGGGSQTRQSNMTWDTLYCRPTQVLVQPSDPQWQVTVAIGYDSFGNVSSETVTGIGMSGRTTGRDFGSDGRFLRSVTNALSQTTQLAWDDTRGVNTLVTDPNLLQTSYLYDGFGRRTRETRPDGTYTERAYVDCSGSGCVNTHNKMLIVDTERTTSGTAIRDSYQYLDGLDRLLVTRSQRVTGAYNRVDREYDAFGRIARESMPCTWAAAGTACTFWTTYTYDLADRITQASRPTSDSDATPAVTSTFYEGLTTRVVDALVKQRSTITNVRGMVARSVDHAGYYQAFDYDAFGNLVRVQDSLGATLQSATYNVRGMRLTSSDADRGNWSYEPNALGELAWQTDANLKTTTYTYDALGRRLTEVMPEGAGSITHTWTWGNSSTSHNIGRLEWMQTSGTGVTTYRETYAYDAFGRPQQTIYAEGATNYTFDFAYAAATGRLEQITYPTSTFDFRFKLRYDYQYGLPHRVWNYDNNDQFWIANDADARDNVTSATLGEVTNGVTFQMLSSFDQVTGVLESRQSTFNSGAVSGTVIENLGFLYDKLGNVIQRQDNRQGLTENFYYDDLHRLDYSTIGATTTDYGYDMRGNITAKTGVGTYTYHPTKLHAVASIDTGSSTLSYSYDANGNMTNRAGSTLAWFANDLPKTITRDVDNSSTFEYAPDRRRWRHVYRTAAANYTHTYLGGLVEKVVGPANTSWKHWVYVNGERISVYIRTSTGGKDRYFFTKDHLGSTAAITHADGPIRVRESFDGHGKRRGVTWSGNPTAGQLATMNEISRRGFTFHEHLDSTELVHMNGRVYDPTIGRFVSADPYIDGWWDTQGHNRYSYAHNSPLTFIDPDGYDDALPIDVITISATRDQQSADRSALRGHASPRGNGGGAANTGEGGRAAENANLQTIDVTASRVTAPAPPPPPTLVGISVSALPQGEPCYQQDNQTQQTVGACWAACMNERLNGAADFLGNALGINSLAFLLNLPVTLRAGAATATTQLGTYTGGIIGRTIAGTTGRSVGIVAGFGTAATLAVSGAALGGYGLGTAGDCAVRCALSDGAYY